MDPKKKYELFRLSKNFCVVPWTNFELFTNGDVKTCSVGSTFLGNVKETEITKILNGKELKKIREDMLADKDHPNCAWCKHRTIDDENFKYLRDHYNSRLENEDINYLDTDSFNLRFVDLHWSNICNLRCIMCNPKQSSLIAKDEEVFFEKIDANNIGKIEKLIIDNQNKLKEIYLSGGEPFYIPHNISLLEKIQNTEIPLRINTNMQWNKNNKLFEILKDKFKNVELTMSVDALGAKFNYIRNGATWEKFVDNVNFVKSNTNFHLRINSIFSVINAIDVAKVVDFFYNKDITDITINILRRPPSLDARNYPVHKKDIIVTQLNRCIESISPEHVNLIANLKNCISQIRLDAKENYEQTLTKITRKHKTKWQDIFQDLI